MTARAQTLERRDKPAIRPAEDAAAPVELSVVIPCLDEAETIATVVGKARDFLAHSGTDGEVVVADNGSTDGSQTLARDAGARVVRAPERGYGAALQAGIAAARGRYVVMGDADDSYDFSDLEPFLEALRGGADLVMGNRFRGGIAPGAMPFLHRYLGNPVLSFLGRLFYGSPIGDFHCGLRGFSREAINGLGLSSPGMEYASEMVVKASLHGLTVTEVPTTLSPAGRSRPPHLRTWSDGWRHLRFLLLHSPNWLFLYPGSALLAIGVALALLLTQGKVQTALGFEIGIHTLLSACFLIVISVQMIVFSVLARLHAVSEGYLPPAPKERFAGLSLESMLKLALVLFLAGLGGFGTVFARWAGSGFGPIEGNQTLIVVALSLTVMTVSVQLASAGFLASVFRMRR